MLPIQRDKNKDKEDWSPREIRRGISAQNRGRVPYGYRYDSNGVLRTVQVFSEKELFRRSELYTQKQGKVRDALLQDRLLRMLRASRQEQETLRVKLENDRGLVFAPDEILSTSNRDNPRAISPHPLSVCEGKSEAFWHGFKGHEGAPDLEKLLELVENNKKEISALESRLTDMEAAVSKGIKVQNKIVMVDQLEKFAIRGLVSSSIFLCIGRIGYYLDSKGSQLSMALILRALKQWRLLFSSERKLIVELAAVLVRSSLNILSVLYIANPHDSSRVFGCLLSIAAWIIERASWKPIQSKIYRCFQSVHALCTWLYFFNQYLSMRIVPAPSQP